MAKSKLVQMNQKIEKTVVEGYREIEDTVVGGYKKIEDNPSSPRFLLTVRGLGYKLAMEEQP